MGEQCAYTAAPVLVDMCGVCVRELCHDMPQNNSLLHVDAASVLGAVRVYGCIRACGHVRRMCRRTTRDAASVLGSRRRLHPCLCVSPFSWHAASFFLGSVRTGLDRAPPPK